MNAMSQDGRSPYQCLVEFVNPNIRIKSLYRIHILSNFP